MATASVLQGVKRIRDPWTGTFRLPEPELPTWEEAEKRPSEKPDIYFALRIEAAKRCFAHLTEKEMIELYELWLKEKSR